LEIELGEELGSQKEQKMEQKMERLKGSVRGKKLEILWGIWMEESLGFLLGVLLDDTLEAWLESKLGLLLGQMLELIHLIDVWLLQIIHLVMVVEGPSVPSLHSLFGQEMGKDLKMSQVKYFVYAIQNKRSP
jgi:hypothetical protein